MTKPVALVTGAGAAHRPRRSPVGWLARASVLVLHYGSLAPISAEQTRPKKIIDGGGPRAHLFDRRSCRAGSRANAGWPPPPRNSGPFAYWSITQRFFHSEPTSPVSISKSGVGNSPSTSKAPVFLLRAPSRSICRRRWKASIVNINRPPRSGASRPQHLSYTLSKATLWDGHPDPRPGACAAHPRQCGLGRGPTYAKSERWRPGARPRGGLACCWQRQGDGEIENCRSGSSISPGRAT